MSADEYLTDEYVAAKLAQEANDCSLKYSIIGMEAYHSSGKKPANMPKPNTRFLRNVIKNTDSHNKSLLAKEAAESKARLEVLEHAEEVKRQKTDPNPREIRRRQMGSIQAILGGKKPALDRSERKTSSKSRTDVRESRQGDDRQVSSGNTDLFSSGRQERKHHGRLAEDRGGRSLQNDDERKTSSKHARDKDRGADRSKRQRDRSGSRERQRRRSGSPNERKRRHRERSPARDSRKTTSKTNNQAEDDSNSPDDVIGPMPVHTIKGRGRLAGASGIDQRFSESYDPSTDVQMDDEGEGNWDDRVEAFRDRQKLKAAQGERLRAAGFGEELIQRAGKNGERSSEDVRWTKAGEQREWDRGKSHSEEET